MDNPTLNHYEEQLYSVFKTFDVDNEESLNRAAVVGLCDALQLEERGATLVDTLFERRTQRVTFTQFRSGLLAVLGAEPPAPAQALAAEPAAASSSDPPPPHSDDDSSGREVAPKFVFGSKKYGRRSRPHRTSSAPEDNTKSEEHVHLQDRSRQRVRCARSSSVTGDSRIMHSTPESGSDLLDHDRRIDCQQALDLCHLLHMNNIDQQLIENIFDAEPTAETTVGEFFGRLNSSLSSSIAATSASDISDVSSCNKVDHVNNIMTNVTLPIAHVVDCWESAGVQQPRRILQELGFTGATVCISDLEDALEDEMRALDEPPDARSLMLVASLALSRLCLRHSKEALDAAVGERDRLRGDLAEANRRARVLAQEVDENHARLEGSLAASLRRAEGKHTDTLRALEEERAAERERAAAERQALQAEVARRADVEARLRADYNATVTKTNELEAKVTAAEERASTANKETERIATELKDLRDSVAAAAGQEPAAQSELTARVEALRDDNKRLRDRCDELAAALESRSAAVPQPTPLPQCTWRDEAAVDDNPASLDHEESDTSMAEAAPPLTAAELQRRLTENDTLHQEEKLKYEDLVKDLEASLDAMRQEYERCEEYWAGKLSEERSAQRREAAASDARLAGLAARIADYERSFAPARLPAIDERAGLEMQVTELEQEFTLHREETARELQRRDDQLAAARARQDALTKELQEVKARAARAASRRRGAGGGVGMVGGVSPPIAPASCLAALAGRAARAEAAVARLTARLAAADMLVKELYMETCLPRRV